MKSFWLIGLCTVILGLTTGAMGALIIDSGTMHAQASASFESTVSTDSMDKPFALPSTTVSADATVAAPGNPTGHADATVAQDLNYVISIDGNTYSTGGSFLDPSQAAGSASGTLQLTETQGESFSAYFSCSTDNAQGDIAIQDAASHTVFATGSIGVGSSTQSVTLLPGDYTLNWSVTSRVIAGGSGPAVEHFTLTPIPEPPATVAGIAVAVLGFCRRAHKQLGSKR